MVFINLNTFYSDSLFRAPLKQIYVSEASVKTVGVELMERAWRFIIEDGEHGGKGSEDDFDGKGSVIFGMMKKLDIELIMVFELVVLYIEEFELLSQLAWPYSLLQA